MNGLAGVLAAVSAYFAIDCLDHGDAPGCAFFAMLTAVNFAGFLRGDKS